MAARTYHILGQPYAWLAPGVALAGIIAQLLAFALKSRPLLLAGTLAVCAAALYERDLTLCVGDVIAAGGLWLLWTKK